jgi:hypothetical protein
MGGTICAKMGLPDLVLEKPRRVGDGCLGTEHSGVYLHRPADSAHSREFGTSRSRAILRRCRYCPPDCDRRAHRLAHVLQCSPQMANPSVRFSSATADAATDRTERPDYFLGRHAEHCLSRCGNGASIGSVSQPDRADRILCRPRHLLIQGLTLKPLLRALYLHDDDPVGRKLNAARERAFRAGLASLAPDRLPVAEVVRQVFTAPLASERPDADTGDATLSAHSKLFRKALQAARQAVLAVRANKNPISLPRLGIDTLFHKVIAARSTCRSITICGFRRGSIKEIEQSCHLGVFERPQISSPGMPQTIPPLHNSQMSKELRPSPSS